MAKRNIEWADIYSKNVINCTQPGCKFSTKIDRDDLKDHMKQKHKYGEYPCTHSNCKFTGYSKVSFL